MLDPDASALAAVTHASIADTPRETVRSLSHALSSGRREESRTCVLACLSVHWFASPRAAAIRSKAMSSARARAACAPARGTVSSTAAVRAICSVPVPVVATSSAVPIAWPRAPARASVSSTLVRRAACRAPAPAAATSRARRLRCLVPGLGHVRRALRPGRQLHDVAVQRQHCLVPRRHRGVRRLVPDVNDRGTSSYVTRSECGADERADALVVPSNDTSCIT